MIIEPGGNGLRFVFYLKIYINLLISITTGILCDLRKTPFTKIAIKYRVGRNKINPLFFRYLSDHRNTQDEHYNDHDQRKLESPWPKVFWNQM